MLISDAFTHKGSASIRQRMEFKNNLIIFLLLIGGYTEKVITTPSSQTEHTTGSTTASTTILTAQTTSKTTTTTPSSTTTTPSTATALAPTTTTAPKTNDAFEYMELPSVQREVAGVEMYFREEPSLSSAPVFNVYLGDAFYMYIRYTGSYHVIKPVECTAYAGVVIDKNVTSMVLWDRNKCSAVDGILEDFRYETNALLSATLYGFQFHQSPYVTIECTVSICNPHSQCAKQTELCHSTKRRRMMAQNPSSLGKGSFRVISAARNTGRPNETSSFLSYTLCWMFAFAIY
nr:uncharacterized protein LOC109618787 [Crassostrea gigas]